MNPNHKGIGFHSSEFKVPSLFETLVSEGKTSSPVFAFKLAQDGGELSIGGLDSRIYSGTPSYANVAIPHNWTVFSTSITVDGSSVTHDIDAAVAPVRPLRSFISLTNLS